MPCPGGIVCIVLSLVHGHCEKLPELCLKTELSQLNQGWTSHAWQDEIKDVKTKHILDILFGISYNSNFQSSACSSRNLLISLSRSFLISSGTIWLPFGATSYQIFFLNIFCAILFLVTWTRSSTVILSRPRSFTTSLQTPFTWSFQPLSSNLSIS